MTGPDEIPAEALQADIETSTTMLHQLTTQIWEEENIPTDWRDRLITIIPKKGDLMECNNYLGIILLSMPGKVLNRIILERLQKAVDKKLRENQAGFRYGRSCSDQITPLRIIIDFEKAFDSLDCDLLWKLMAHYGIPRNSLTSLRTPTMVCSVK